MPARARKKLFSSRHVHPFFIKFNRKTACPFSRGPEPINLAIPDAPRVALCSPPSSTLCAASRWPSAMLDGGCAQRLAENRPGRRNGSLSRTEKHRLALR